MNKLQDILGIVDDDAKFMRWVAEMEHSEHEWTERNLAGGCRRCGIDWIKRQYHRHCILTRSLAEIVAAKVKGVDFTELVLAIWKIAPEEYGKNTAVLLAYEWYIKAGSKLQYVTLAVAEGKVK